MACLPRNGGAEPFSRRPGRPGLARSLERRALALAVTLGLFAAPAFAAPPGRPGSIANEPAGFNATAARLLSINDVSVTEGNSGTVSLVFTVTLSEASTSQDVTVDYTTQNGTATLSNSDYVMTNGTLTIPPDSLSGKITVLVNGDQVRESNETVIVRLSNPVQANIADDQGVGTILNDDVVPGLSISDALVVEGNTGTTSAVFTVSLSNPTDQQVTVNYATADSTATLANNDYVAASGTVTISAKSSFSTFTVPVKGDWVRESNERFEVNLSSPTNASIVDGHGAGIIQNDDGLPSLSIDDVTIAEGNSGTATAVFTVTLSNASDQQVTVQYATADSTATLANGDYQAASGTLTVPAKALSGSFTVAVNGDLAQESDERFLVNLSSPSGATIADGQGVGTIQDDDLIPTLFIDDVSVTEGNTGTVNAVFTVSLSSVATEEVTVNYATADSTATLANGDYQAASGTVTIPVEDQSVTLTVPVNGDAISELSERFLVNLSSPSGATITDGQGVGTILNDDPVPTLTIDDVTVAEGNAGTVNAVFTVTLSGLAGQAVTVNYTTADSTATLANGDYVATSGTLTIPAKTLSTTVTVVVNGDGTRESDERFLVNLSNPTNATIADGKGIGTILNDDALPSLTINNVTVTEGNSGTVNAVFTVTLSNPTSQAVTVNYASADSTATLANSDYVAASGTLTIPAKTLATTLTVLVNGDATRESDERFLVNLTSPSGATIADAQGVGTILNNDAAPSLSISDVSVTEGNAGTVNAVFTVSLSNPSDQQVTVNYATADSTATLSNGDYQAGSGTLTIPAKTLSTTVTVLVNGDGTRESDERFLVNLSSPSGATITDGQGVGTILNDDPIPTLSISDITVTEGNAGTTNAVFTVSLSSLASQAVTVNYATADSTATLANSDYVATSGTLTIPAKTLSTTVTVLVNGDGTRESDERFLVNLSSPANATIADGKGIGTIQNDDVVPTLSIGDVTVTEGNSGTVNAVFTVSLSNPTSQAVTVNYATADSTATLANSDYVATSGTLTIPAKTLSATLTVLVNGDATHESDERFLVNLNTPSGATIADGQGVGTILNNDSIPSLSIGNRMVTEGNSGTVNAVFTVSLSNPTTQTVMVNYATADSSATVANGDYQGTSGTLTIPAKTSSATVTVLVNGDVIRESNERFLVNLSNPVGATIDDGQGIGTINNDDPVPTFSIGDVTVTEGNAGTVNAVFTVSLSNPVSGAVTVDYATADSTATLANGDYQASSGTLTISPKAPSATLTVLVNGDGTLESNERFLVNLSNPSGGTIADGQGIGTILNDDAVPTLAIGDVAVTEGNAGTVNAVFTVSLSNLSNQAVTVSYSTADSTATLSNGDYQASSGTLTIPAKTPSATLTVPVNGDVTHELDERFLVNLSAPSGATIADGKGVGTILNDDAVPGLTINNVTVTEGNSGTTSTVFTVSLSNLSSQVVTVNYATADSTATLANGDYVATSGTLTIPAKTLSATLTVPVNGDAVMESDEVFLVNLSGPTNATIASGHGIGTILNDDTVPTLTIGDVTVTEGDGPGTMAVFTVSLSHLTAQAVTVDYASADSTATLADGDYQAVTGTLTIPPKTLSATLSVPVTGDQLGEPTEMFLVNLSNVNNAVITDAQGVGTIIDDDTPSITISDVTVIEGESGADSAVFTVSLTGTTTQTVTVNYTTADSTATLANGDFVAASGVLSFPGLSASRTISVLVNGDRILEPDEQFLVNLSNPVNAAIDDRQGVGTIQNDDALPSLTIADVTVVEGTSGTTGAVFTVTLSNPTAQAVTVSYATTDSTATLANNDYVPASGVLTIPPKAPSGIFTVLVNGDRTQESNERFLVNLSAPANATIVDGHAVGTIQNDDGLPGLAIDDVTVTEGNSGTVNAVFTVSLSNPTDQVVTVGYATTDGSATQTSDYQATSGTLTLPAKTASATFSVPVNGDAMRESNELFLVLLSSPVNATIADGTGIGTILNDDPVPSLAIDDPSVAEGDTGKTWISFTVTLSNPTDQAVKVNFTTADSTATLANYDYQATSGTLTIPAKSLVGTISVPTNGDRTQESDEAFLMILSGPAQATLADGRGVGTIRNDDGLPSLAISDVSLIEGNSGTRDAVFTVSLSHPTDRPVGVDFTTVDVTATLANNDYQATSGRLTIPAKAPSATITVRVNGDLVQESDETFRVSLSNTSNAALADGNGIGTIRNDDGLPSATINDVTLSEGNSGSATALFTVSLSNPTDQPVTMNFATGDGSATVANGDYQAASGTLTIPAKTLSSTISVTVNGDLIQESDEIFLLTLSNPTNATIADGVGVGTLLNDDGGPTLTISDVSVVEGDSATTTAMVFTVALSNPTDRVVTVDYATADVTATQTDNDYVATSNTLTIPTKASSGAITVTVIGDRRREPNETFLLSLSNPHNATLADNQVVGTIMTDEVLHVSFAISGTGLSPYGSGTLTPAWGDADNDGDVDLPLHRNHGGGRFSEVPAIRTVLNDGNYHGSAWGDYDKDGHLDLVLTGYPLVPTRTLLLHNQGDGTFVDVAPGQNIDIDGHGETPVWADFDADGWPDLFAPYYSHISPFRSFLYHNEGDGSFSEVAEAAGVSLPNIPIYYRPEGAQAADWDDDGDLDLYCASHLFINDGYGNFADVREAVGLPLLFDEGAMFVDYDNDGDLDLYLRSEDSARLFRNDGGHFTDVTLAAGIQPSEFLWGDSWADVDNDGDLDLLYLVDNEPARLMLNRGDGTLALDASFTALNVRAAMSAWADADNDGDLDVVVGASPYQLWANQINNQPAFPHSYLRVRVLDADGRETQHGSTVHLRRVGGPPGVVQTRVVSGGSAYLAQNEYIVHFGVPDDGPYAMEVDYPSAPGSRVIVNVEDNPLLGDLRPSVVADRMIIVRRDGTVVLHEETGGTVDVGPGANLPKRAFLETPVPNPIRLRTTVAFSLPSGARASLAVFDITGRQVTRLVDGDFPAGKHWAHWDRSDERGQPVPAGIYFLKLFVDGQSAGYRRVAVLR